MYTLPSIVSCSYCEAVPFGITLPNTSIILTFYHVCLQSTQEMLLNFKNSRGFAPAKIIILKRAVMGRIFYGGLC